MQCWVCGSNNIPLYHKGKNVIGIRTEDLRITDSRYGLTLPIYKCRSCGFLQCDIGDLSGLYEQLEDKEYIESSEQRKKQLGFLLKRTLPYIPGCGGRSGALPASKILDVGAGAGLFVESALERGLDAQGIEPSAFLANYAAARGLPVINASAPNYPPDSFDAVYMTDVLEHIADPANLLLAYNKILKPGGPLFVTTPDVSSALARVMGKRWWHYRLAHVGYYNKKTLKHIMAGTGFELRKYLPVKWYFTGEYVFERLGQYVSFLRGKHCPKALGSLMISVSFGDSILAVYTKKKA
jgi:2-polyprenyl-3-methyl-5-hydroxy-6-metoxy-1,4-benzoquinol methylase